MANWFTSYLTSCKQRITIDGTLSTEFELKCGVPQGSCAGPVTFLSYISSLYDVIHEHDINVGGNADDNQLYISFKPSLDGKNEQEAVAKLNECINDVRKWML